MRIFLATGLLALLLVGPALAQDTTCYDLQPNDGAERTDTLCLTFGPPWTATPTEAPTVTARATATAIPADTPTFTPTVQPTPTASPGVSGRIVPDQYPTIVAALSGAPSGTAIYVRAGTYAETVIVATSGITLAAYPGDRPWIDGECSRANGIQINASDVTVRGLGVKRTGTVGIMIGGLPSGAPARATVDGNTIQDFNCSEATGGLNAGIASYYGGPGQRVTNNTITRRVELPGPPQGYGDGIWFKSTTARPSGGGHLLAGNTIVGGWDGIGGEVEGDIHGSFDHDSAIEKNTISLCGDDGIQSEGGGAGILIQDNTITDCGVGIALATPLTGPTTVQRNTIASGVVGTLGSHMCFKVGNTSTATIILTGNRCTITGAGGSGIQQTNSGVAIYRVSGNVWNVNGYIFNFGYTIPAASTFDADCMVATDPTRFAKMLSTDYRTLGAFQSASKQEPTGTTGPCAP